MVDYGINNEAAKSLNSMQLLTINPSKQEMSVMAAIRTIIKDESSQGNLYICPTCNKEFRSIRKKKYCSLMCRPSKICKTLYVAVANCQVCGEPLETTGGGRKYCSDTCCSMAYARRNGTRPRDEWIESVKAVPSICKQCGDEFMPQRGGNKTAGSGSFCSRRCQWDWAKINIEPMFKPQSCKIWYCDVCGAVMRKFGKYCSSECIRINSRNNYDKNRDAVTQYIRDRYKKGWQTPAPFKCKTCGCEVTPEFGDKRRMYCSDKCSKKINRTSTHRKRARKYGVEYEPVNMFKVFKRDGWHCQICGKATPMGNRGTRYSNAPELDHRVPMSKGGPHTYTNVQCSCRACNAWKSNHNELGQLPLFGVGSC